MSGLDWYVIAAPCAVVVLLLGLGLLSAVVVRLDHRLDQALAGQRDAWAEHDTQRDRADQLQARLDTYRGLAAERLDPGSMPRRQPRHPGEDC